jgi:hypothetical protein
VALASQNATKTGGKHLRTEGMDGNGNTRRTGGIIKIDKGGKEEGSRRSPEEKRESYFWTF